MPRNPARSRSILRLLIFNAQIKSQMTTFTLWRRQSQRNRTINPKSRSQGYGWSKYDTFPKSGFCLCFPQVWKHMWNLNLRPLTKPRPTDPQTHNNEKPKAAYDRAGGTAWWKIILRKGAPPSHTPNCELHGGPACQHRYCPPGTEHVPMNF